MKKIQIVIGEDTTIDLENPYMTQYRMTKEVPDNFIVRRESIGKPLTIITDNVPEPLRKEIDKIVRYYCNT